MNTEKLISAETAEQMIIKALVDCMIKHKGIHEVSDAVLDALHNVPAVDAAPVVHGRWIPRKGKWFVYYQCSVCGEK